MDAILRGTGAGTRLLVASLRDADRIIDLARQGLDTFTFGPEVAAALLQDDLADEAAAAFEAAAAAQRR
jgi:transaldolase